MATCSARPSRPDASGPNVGRSPADDRLPFHPAADVPLGGTAAVAAPTPNARRSSPAPLQTTTQPATSSSLHPGRPSATAAGPPLSQPPNPLPFAVALALPQARQPAKAGSRLVALGVRRWEGWVRSREAGYA